MTKKSTFSIDGSLAGHGTCAHETGKASPSPSQGGDVLDMHVLYEVCAGIPLKHRRSEATAARQACQAWLREAYAGKYRYLKVLDRRRSYSGRAMLRNGRAVHYEAYRLPRLVEVLSAMIDEALENPAKRCTFEEN